MISALRDKTNERGGGKGVGGGEVQANGRAAQSVSITRKCYSDTWKGDEVKEQISKPLYELSADDTCKISTWWYSESHSKQWQTNGHDITFRNNPW